MNEIIELKILKKENELLKAQNNEYKELLTKQTDNSLIATKLHNSAIKWFILAMTAIILWNVGWLLGGYFFSDYQDHNVYTDNSSKIENSQNSSIRKEESK
jgi:uncharacterized protein YigA (DUF484 family)